MLLYRRCVSYVLVATIGVNVLALPLSYLSFKVNQDYYATVLCENPEKPITVCGGICYLKKQLPQSEQGEPATFLSKIDVGIFFQYFSVWSHSVDQLYACAYPPYASLRPVAYGASLFHPPQG